MQSNNSLVKASPKVSPFNKADEADHPTRNINLQDKVRSSLNSDEKASTGGKIVPPNSNIKRFKTQSGEMDSAQPPESIVQDKRTSSLADEISDPNNRTNEKIEMNLEKRRSQIWDTEGNVSVNENTVYLSDNELSIVESDSGQNDLDSPA